MSDQQRKVYSFKSVGETIGQRQERENTVATALPIGIKTPLRLSQNDSSLFVMNTTLASQLRDNFKNMLSTNHGERYMLFDYGANLLPLAFELGTDDFDSLAIQNISTTSLSMREIYNNNSSIINNILLLNAIMLLFGLLGELKTVSKHIGFFIGTICLSLSFYLIYSHFVNNQLLNQILFWFNFILWSIYGFAYLMSFDNKNITYNILDVFSKNINGLMILVYIIFIYFNK